jgi:hypothetical protein
MKELESLVLCSEEAVSSILSQFSPSIFYRVQTMVHNTQNHWISGLCSSPAILTTRKQFNWVCLL